MFVFVFERMELDYCDMRVEQLLGILRRESLKKREFF